MTDDTMDPIEAERYARITAVIKKISVLLNAVGDRLPWYIEMTRQLSIQTAPKTGVTGDQIEEMARALAGCLPIIKKMVDRAHELDKKIHTARLN